MKIAIFVVKIQPPITQKANIGLDLGRKPKRAQITDKKFNILHNPIVEKGKAYCANISREKEINVYGR